MWRMIVAGVLVIALSGCASSWFTRGIDAPFQEQQQRLDALYEEGKLGPEDYARLSQENTVAHQQARLRGWKNAMQASQPPLRVKVE